MGIRHALVLVLLAPLQALACSPCRTMVFAAVFDSHFALRLTMTIFPVALLVGLAVWLYRSTEARSTNAHLRQP
jgi:hypothetical protein